MFTKENLKNLAASIILISSIVLGDCRNIETLNAEEKEEDEIAEMQELASIASDVKEQEIQKTSNNGHEICNKFSSGVYVPESNTCRVKIEKPVNTENIVNELLKLGGLSWENTPTKITSIFRDKKGNTIAEIKTPNLKFILELKNPLNCLASCPTCLNITIDENNSCYRVPSENTSIKDCSVLKNSEFKDGVCFVKTNRINPEKIENLFNNLVEKCEGQVLKDKKGRNIKWGGYCLSKNFEGVGLYIIIELYKKGENPASLNKIKANNTLLIKNKNNVLGR